MVPLFKYFTVSIFLVLSPLCFGQNETKKWFFGNGAGLNFSNNPPTVITGGAITTSVGCASIADASGNLLFYTDGVTVYDQTHTIMANGTGLLGNDAAQSAMILKKPGSVNLYYIFTVQGNNGSAGFNYSIVDMSLASGNGSVTAKNVSLSSGACSDRLTATRHCNGTDYWLLIYDGAFKSYSLTASGITSLAAISTPVITSTTTTSYSMTGTGCMKLSPNGRKLIAASTSTTLPSSSSGFHYNAVTLFDFDNVTGFVSNAQKIYNDGSFFYLFYHTYGCEFSPDGSKVYVNWLSAFGGIVQLDLCAPTLSASNSYYITNSEGSNLDLQFKRTFQLAPDGKIYLAVPSNTGWTTFVGSNSLAVINNPNALGNACNYNQVGQSLGSYTCQWGLPNFPGSFFEQRPVPSFSYSSNPPVCNTVSFSPVSLCSGSGYDVIGYQWLFGDPGSGSANTSFLANPTHSYPGTGNYSVRLVRSFSCFTDTVVQTIHVTSPSVSISSPSLACSVHTATASATGGTGPYTFSWNPGSQSASVATISTTAVYTVTMNDEGGGCAATATAYISSAVVDGTVTSADALCHAVSNGSASISVSPGSGSYSYGWSNTTQTTNAVVNLSAGSYSVSVFDQVNNCTVTKTFTINQPNPINVNAVSVASYSACAGNSLSLLSNATGGTAPYQFFWSSGPAVNVYTVSEAVPGVYVYTANVTDSHNCTASNTVSILFAPLPSVVVSNVTLCAGSTASFNASGASSYTWYPGFVNGNSYTMQPTVSTLYFVIAEHLGCTVTKTVSAFVYPLPNVNLTSNSPVCEGQTLLLNGSSSASYLLTGPQGFQTTQQNSSIVNAALNNGGNYFYTVTDNNGCSATMSISVSVLVKPIVSVSGNLIVCEVQSTTLTASGASNYTWSSGSNSNSIIVNPSVNTTYTVSATGTNSCVGTSVVSVSVNPNPVLTLTGNTVICAGESTTISAAGASTYSWNTGANSTSIVVMPISNTTYIVNGYFPNTGCSSTTSYAVKISNCSGIQDLENKVSVIKIYPNPSSGILFIDSEFKVELKLYNNLGQLSLETSVDTGLNSINLLSYDSGIYTLVSTGAFGNSVYKFILSRE